MDAYKYLKKLMLTVIVFLLSASALGVAGGFIGNPGKSLNDSARAVLGNTVKKAQDADTAQDVTISSLVRRIIPPNIFSALADGDVLGVLVFSIFLGVALGFVNQESSKEIFSVLDSLFNSFLIIINWSMYILPVALFSLMAKQTAGMGPEIMLAMGRFVIIYHILCFAGIIFMAFIISVRVRTGFVSVFRKLKNALLVAFGTSNSYAAMPLAIESLEKEFGLNRKTVNLVMPLGTTVCRPGTIINLALGTIFIAQLFNVSMLENFRWLGVIFGVVLSGFAAAGAPGAIEISMLSIFFPLMGLPVEVAMVLLLAVNSITDPVRTMLNIISNSAVTSIVSEKDRKPAGS